MVQNQAPMGFSDTRIHNVNFPIIFCIMYHHNLDQARGFSSVM